MKDPPHAQRASRASKGQGVSLRSYSLVPTLPKNSQRGSESECTPIKSSSEPMIERHLVVMNSSGPRAIDQFAAGLSGSVCKPASARSDEARRCSADGVAVFGSSRWKPTSMMSFARVRAFESPKLFLRGGIGIELPTDSWEMLNRARVVQERCSSERQSRRPSVRSSSEHFTRREFADRLRESGLFDVAMRSSSELRQRPLDQTKVPKRFRGCLRDDLRSFGVCGLHSEKNRGRGSDADR